MILFVTLLPLPGYSMEIKVHDVHLDGKLSLRRYCHAGATGLFYHVRIRPLMIVPDIFVAFELFKCKKIF
jgi:hypothetical protein